MADQRGEQIRHGGEIRHTAEDMKRAVQERSPPASKVVAVATLFPVGGILLALSGMTLVGTIFGLAVSTPLFILFSPVLFPAAIVIGLALTGFLASGALGLTAVTALTWIVNYFRAGRGGRDIASSMHEQMEHVKRRVAEAAGHAGQKTKDAGQSLERKGHETTGRA